MYVRNSHYSTHGVKYIPSHHDCYCSFLFCPLLVTVRPPYMVAGSLVACLCLGGLAASHPNKLRKSVKIGQSIVYNDNNIFFSCAKFPFLRCLWFHIHGITPVARICILRPVIIDISFQSLDKIQRNSFFCSIIDWKAFVCFCFFQIPI